MTNPFQYGGVVGPGAFCNRDKELSDLRRAAENAERIFVYAERRLGKTSLIKRVLDDLPKKEYLTVYMDLWPTDGPTSLVTTVAKAFAEATSTRVGNLLETAKSLFAHLTPTLTLDEMGNPSLQFGPRSRKVQEPELDEVLSAPARIAARDGRRLVVVYDEFQRLLEYDADSVERLLRSAVQEHQGIAYFFLGSRKHLIQRMFLDASRPLYRSAGHYPLAPIATEHWKPFIREHFEKADKHIEDDAVVNLCQLTAGHPFYTQHLAHALWERTPAGGEVTGATLLEATEMLLNREAYAYTTLWETLTRNQQRFLRGLASEPTGVKSFSADFVQQYGLRTPSNVQRAAESLLVKDIVDRDNGSFTVTDRFFRLWIQRL